MGMEVDRVMDADRIRNTRGRRGGGEYFGEGPEFGWWKSGISEGDPSGTLVCGRPIRGGEAEAIGAERISTARRRESSPTADDTAGREFRRKRAVQIADTNADVADG